MKVTHRATAQAILTLISWSIPSVAQTGTTWPAGGPQHAMLWHPRLQQIVLVGESRDTTMLGWNGTAWRVLGNAPGGLSNEAAAYDDTRDRVVVHGGAALRANQPTAVDATWEWDGGRWRLRSLTGPGARDHHAMVYDPLRKQVVLFGGLRSPDSTLSDTWGWDGRAWQQLAHEGPPARSTHRLTFDSGRGVVVLFGGYGADGRPLNDTWEWDGRRWREVVTKTAPTPRGDTRIAYDPARKRVVLFGGHDGNSSLADTWEYDGQEWTKLDVAGPVLRNAHEMAYDRRTKAIVLFGGRGDLRDGGDSGAAGYDDLWMFNGAWKEIPRPDAHPVEPAYVIAGPHAVGYRVIDYWDQSRSTAPARDFEGLLGTGQRAMPMQVSIWYPAQGGGLPMRFGEYWALSARSATLGPATEAEILATSSRIRSGMAFVLGVEVPQATADSIRDLRTTAVRDALPAAGPFPVVITGAGPGGGSGLAEYLASHGYVVVSAPTVGTASQQVGNVPVAMETHTRNLETSTAIAASLPFVDLTRLGVLGVNFDGLAALTYQMRNMSASAVISLDGYETKTATATGLRRSAYYDPARLRVPYLAFAQDNPPVPSLQFSDSLARELKYSERFAYVVRGMEHAHLLGNLTVYPQLRAEQRLGYEFIWRTILAFLDGFVKNDTAGRAFMSRSAVQNGFPSWLLKTELKWPALAAIPTVGEVEQIAMTGHVDRLRTIFRRARATDSTVQIFTQSQLNLFAFRFAQRGEHAVAIEFNALAAEAFPSSTSAANNLAKSYRDGGQLPRAIEQWNRALLLIDTDPAIALPDRLAWRASIEASLRALPTAR